MADTSSNLRSIVDHDGAVILDISRDEFFSLNTVGAFIWTHLGNGESLEGIKTALSAETGMDMEVVSVDVDEFVAELKNKKLFHFSRYPQTRQEKGA
jgi:Coenzyme PQQ synthesis protein D (PqqD)